MPRIAYTTAQKQEAVALARVAGVEAAAQSLGIDRRTVRKWSDQAGDRPELDGSAEGWQRLLDLAQSKVAVALSNGTVRPKDAAVIAAIAERNLRQLEDRFKKRKTGEPLAIDARDVFVEWIFDTLPEFRPDAMPDEEDALDAHVIELGNAVSWLQAELLRRAKVEQDATRGYVSDQPTPHRRALLAWHSGRTEWEGVPIIAGDILEWAQAHTLAIVGEHSSLLAWYRRELAIESRERVIRDRAYLLAGERGMHLHEAVAFVRQHVADDLVVPRSGDAA